MSKLEELIQELCPDGVEYKTLGELCNTITTGKLNANAMVENGEYPFYTCDSTPYRIDKYAFDEESILISGNGSQVGHVNYYKGKFNAYQRTYVLYDFKEIHVKYLLHYLKGYLRNYIIVHSKKGSIPYITLPMLKEFKLPVPPLEVQCEIVRILDKFTLLTAELTAELTARRKQYEYYRKKLFEEVVEKSEIMKIQDISKNISSGGTPSTSITEYYNGEIPWLRTQEVNFNEIWDTKVKITNLALQNSSVKMIPANCVIVAMYGATVGRAGINKIPLTTNQACCNIEINEIKANYKYLFYWLLEKYDHIKSLGQGSQTNINSNIIKKLELPIPSLHEQIKIVDILDRFDKLCNDITSGLPAEIELNNKRYEYYRDKLLTFKEKK